MFVCLYFLIFYLFCVCVCVWKGVAMVEKNSINTIKKHVDVCFSTQKIKIISHQWNNKEINCLAQSHKKHMVV